ncbi:hypothetical protein B0A58_08220 [Flavobacterium branchiophilum NBRC 15030 = ATCC 35035]|nr:hypothetical protein B0A58_08220 [Flavobacterium branchiophilum NBRC 15030 = ATCC 35035]
MFTRSFIQLKTQLNTQNSIKNISSRHFWHFHAGPVPALRYNLFVFNEKTKRISTPVGARLPLLEVFPSAKILKTLSAFEKLIGFEKLFSFKTTSF